MTNEIWFKSLVFCRISWLLNFEVRNLVGATTCRDMREEMCVLRFHASGYSDGLHDPCVFTQINLV